MANWIRRASSGVHTKRSRLERRLQPGLDWLPHIAALAATKRRLQPAVTGESPVPPRNRRGAQHEKQFFASCDELCGV
jgi:hypothetical protein